VKGSKCRPESQQRLGRRGFKEKRSRFFEEGEERREENSSLTNNEEGGKENYFLDGEKDKGSDDNQRKKEERDFRMKVHFTKEAGVSKPFLEHHKGDSRPVGIFTK